MCISPITLKKTGASTDIGKHYVTNKVPCGKCFLCLKRRAAGWTFRLNEEAKRSSSAYFITLTYDPENLPFTEDHTPTLSKEDYQKFMKRLRKRVGTGIKFYACGEYGTETHRPHYHAIMFNIKKKYAEDDTILNAWANGNVKVDKATPETFAYVTKYIMKNTWNKKQIIDTDTGEVIQDKREKEFSLMSKRLGDNFLSKEMKKYLKQTLTGIVKIGGYPTALPKYFKEKIFTTEERLVLKKLATDRQEMIYLNSFDGDPIKENEWLKDQVRKHKKWLNQNRKTL